MSYHSISLYVYVNMIYSLWVYEYVGYVGQMGARPEFTISNEHNLTKTGRSCSTGRSAVVGWIFWTCIIGMLVSVNRSYFHLRLSPSVLTHDHWDVLFGFCGNRRPNPIREVSKIWVIASIIVDWVDWLAEGVLVNLVTSRNLKIPWLGRRDNLQHRKPNYICSYIFLGCKNHGVTYFHVKKCISLKPIRWKTFPRTGRFGRPHLP